MNARTVDSMMRVLRHEAVFCNDLARTMQVSSSAVSKKLRELEGKGVISSTPVGYRVLYHADGPEHPKARIMRAMLGHQATVHLLDGKTLTSTQATPMVGVASKTVYERLHRLTIAGILARHPRDRRFYASQATLDAVRQRI